MRETLVARFPKCFMPKRADKLPLAKGIRQAVISAAPDLDPLLIGAAIRDYVHGRKYQDALVMGAMRVDLDGQEIEAVTQADAAWARMTLEHLEARWENHRQKQTHRAKSSRSTKSPNTDTPTLSPPS
jgi:ProP effector